MNYLDHLFLNLLSEVSSIFHLVHCYNSLTHLPPLFFRCNKRDGNKKGHLKTAMKVRWENQCKGCFFENAELRIFENSNLIDFRFNTQTILQFRQFLWKFSLNLIINFKPYRLRAAITKSGDLGLKTFVINHILMK